MSGCSVEIPRLRTNLPSLVVFRSLSVSSRFERNAEVVAHSDQNVTVRFVRWTQKCIGWRIVSLIAIDSRVKVLTLN